jgi:uncharacterized protein
MVQRNAPHPRKLDVAVFARAGGELSGEAAWADLPRLAQTCVPGRPGAPVPWSVRGEVVRKTGLPDAIRLHLTARAEVWLECQRCLEPLADSLAIDCTARFVEGEEAAAALDAESEEDVLALSYAFDLVEWLEDELLLALPLVPRHSECRPPMPAAGAAPPAAEAPAGQGEPRPNPFAALAALKDRKRSGS